MRISGGSSCFIFSDQALGKSGIIVFIFTATLPSPWSCISAYILSARKSRRFAVRRGSDPQTGAAGGFCCPSYPLCSAFWGKYRTWSKSRVIALSRQAFVWIYRSFSCMRDSGTKQVWTRSAHEKLKIRNVFSSSLNLLTVFPGLTQGFPPIYFNQADALSQTRNTNWTEIFATGTAYRSR